MTLRDINHDFTNRTQNIAHHHQKVKFILKDILKSFYAKLLGNEIPRGTSLPRS